MSSVRLRRLKSDYEKLRDFVKRHPRLKLIQAEGDPPELYQLEFRIKSLRQVDDQMKIVKSHLVEITLPRNYPRTPPQCRMLSPVFHPNIAPHAICVGDHWSAGEPLWSIVARIGEILAFQSYNTKSPLNGEAARWVEENKDDLPLDPVSMLVDEPQPPSTPTPRPASDSDSAAPKRPASATKQPATQQPTIKPPKADNSADTISIQCGACGTRYRVPAGIGAKRVRCKKCQGLIEINTGSASS